jgi:outer membrane protein TolC
MRYSLVDQRIKYSSYTSVVSGGTVLAVLLAAIVLGGAPQRAVAQSTGDEGADAAPVRVAMIVDPGPSADTMAGRVESELRSLFGGHRPVRTTRRAGTEPWDRSDVRSAFRAAVSTEPDALVLVGPVASVAVCAGETPLAGRTDVPVVAIPMATALSGPKLDGDACEVAVPRREPTETAEALGTVAAYDTLVVATDARVAEHLPRRTDPGAPRSNPLDTPVRYADIEDGRLTPPVSRSESTAVFLHHTDRLDPAALGRLVDRLTAAGHPVFGGSEVLVRRHGALAAHTERSTPARPAALAVEGAITGSPPPVASSPPAAQLVVHRGTADRLGLALSWDLRVEATLVGTTPPSEPPLSLAASMREGIRSSLALRAERQETAAQAHGVDVARSNLLPQVRASASGTRVSEDVAAASFGSQPEREVTSTLSFRQVLFNEPAFAQWSVEKRMQAVREFEQQSSRLDAAKRAADAYLGVLQARARVKIQRENLRVVRTNLAAARTRQRAGAADPREVHRLTSQEARAEQGLLRALGRERTAEIRYNRVLDRPLDAPVALSRSAGVDPEPMLESFPYDDLLDRPRAADSFRQFWVAEARTRAPEVQAMERLVSARKRQRTSTTRSFWLPRISLEGALSQRMFEDGSGTTGLTLPLSGGGSGPSTFDAPTPPDQQWSLSLTASLPLFSGMERAARRQQATDQLAASRTRRMAAELGVEQAVRTALVDLETSHQAVERALEAADAAQRTLDVTQAAYREGTASLIDLIDAQTTALTTRQEASDAAYELMRDWVAVQRAGGSFRVLRTPEQQDAFQRRLNAVLASSSPKN